MNGIRKAVDWALHSEGSTRSAALIRIGLAVAIWARWGDEMLLYQDPTPKSLVLSLSFFTATTMMFVGVFSRFSSSCAGLVLLTMYHYFGIELGREPWTHHHTYLLAVGTTLCSLTPCGGSYSVDRWWALRRQEIHGIPASAERANVWGLRLIALQLSTVYLFTAYDKTHWGFLSGDRLEHYLAFYYFGSQVPTGAGFHAAMMATSASIVALEYGLGIGLLFRRTRRWLILPGLVLHGAFYVLLPVKTYTATMWILYLAYLDPDAVHRFLDRLQGHKG